MLHFSAVQCWEGSVMGLYELIHGIQLPTANGADGNAGMGKSVCFETETMS